MSVGAIYDYDDNGRVTDIWWDDGSMIKYHYDDLGNRTVVLEQASCCGKFTLHTKSGNFTADDGPGSYYRITANATVTLPPSPADGSVMKFKVTGGTATFTFYSAQTFNHANGVSDQNLVLTAQSGVLELISVANGWDET